MEFLQEPLVMIFGPRNPGFDSVIVSPCRENARKVHLTFTEARYSAEKSTKVESFDEYKSKYASVQETVNHLQRALDERAQTLATKKPSEKDTVHKEEVQSPTKGKGKEGQKPDIDTIEWHFVYALYRKARFTQSDVHSNTILMDRDGLSTFYGPSLASLGML
jgi:hypothetical protein